MHSDATIWCFSLGQQKSVISVATHPFSPLLNDTGSCFPLTGCEGLNLLRRLAHFLTPALWSLQTFRKCQTMKSRGHLFSQAVPRVPGLPLPAPLQVSPAMQGEGRAGGNDSFTAAAPTPPFMLDRVKAPGLLQAERQENKIKSPGSARTGWQLQVAGGAPTCTVAQLCYAVCW